MKKKGEANVGMIIMMLILIVVGIVLIQAIFAQQSILTSRQTVSGEVIDISTGKMEGGQINVSNPANNHTLTNAPTGWKLGEGGCTTIAVSYGNSSNSTALVEDTDYILYPTGILKPLNTSMVVYTIRENSTRISYSYCADGYNKDSSSRTMAGLIGLFVALALVVVLAGYGLREWID